jgi:hypothetical protein
MKIAVVTGLLTKWNMNVNSKFPPGLPRGEEIIFDIFIITDRTHEYTFLFPGNYSPFVG